VSDAAPLSLEIARARMLAAVAPVSGTELVALGQLAGRILAETLCAPRDLPDADCSAMDGYAVRHADLSQGASLRLVGAERRVRFPRRLGLVAHYAAVDALVDHGEMHVGRDWYVGLAPTPRGELNVGMALPLDDGNGAAELRFAAAIDRLPAVAARLRGSRRLSPIRGAAPIGHRVSSVAGAGWLLVGDAAGFVDPFTGEGIHRALRSARAAAQAIADGGDVAAAYRRERRRAFAAKSALTWLVQGFLAVPPLLDHAIDRLGERPRAALRLGSALGDCRPATDVLSPRALMDVIAP